MLRWIFIGLLTTILVIGGPAGASPAQAQVPPRPIPNGIPSAECQQDAVTRCDTGCGNDNACKFGCQIGGINNRDTCASSCTGLGASCLNACLGVTYDIQLCAYPTVGGVVSGLGAGQSVVLQNSGGAPLTVNANGAFAFPQWITLFDAYAVTVSGQPSGQNCSVSNGAGVADSAAVIPGRYGITNVVVTCVVSVPTMSDWGMVVLVAILAIGGALLLIPFVVRPAAPAP